MAVRVPSWGAGLDMTFEFKFQAERIANAGALWRARMGGWGREVGEGKGEKGKG